MFSLPALAAFAQIVLVDLSLAGDNAVAVGMSASALPPKKRKQAIMAGIAAATVLRLVFAIFAVQLMHLIGLTLAGGILLFWVGWKMVRELRHEHPQHDAHGGGEEKSLREAIVKIVIADVSMSLDNVLAVAGIARDHLWTLAAGLALSVLLMGIAASYVARLVERYMWIAYGGVAIVFYTAMCMIWDGAHQIAMP